MASIDNILELAQRVLGACGTLELQCCCAIRLGCQLSSTQRPLLVFAEAMEKKDFKPSEEALKQHVSESKSSGSSGSSSSSSKKDDDDEARDMGFALFD